MNRRPNDWETASNQDSDNAARAIVQRLNGWSLFGLPRDVFGIEEVGIGLKVVWSGLVQVARLSQKGHPWHHS